MNKFRPFSSIWGNRFYWTMAVAFMFFCFSNNAWAQPCDTAFVKRIGQVGVAEKAYKVLPIPDGNLLVSGLKSDASLLMKVSPSGEVLWERLFDIATGNDYIYEMLVDSDGMLVIVGRYVHNANTVSYIMRYDYLNDVVLWTVKMPDPSKVRLDGVLEQTDGTYLAFGNTRYYKQLFAIDRADGSLLWDKSYKTGSHDSFRDAVLMDSVIYTANIQRYNSSLGKTRPGISKLNLDGSQVWTRNYLKSLPSVATIHANNIVAVNDTLAVLGYGNLTYVEPYPYKIQFFTTDLDGNVHWAKQYNLPGNYQYARDLIALPDGYLLLAEITQYYATELLVMKIDKEGQKVWAKTIGGPYDESARSFTVMGEHIYFVGHSESFDSENDIIIGKMGLNGNGAGDECTIVADAVVSTSNINAPYSGEHLMEPKTYNFAPILDTLASSTSPALPNIDMPGCGCIPHLCNILIENPGFENGLTEWNALGEVAIVADAATGTKAVEICGQDEGSVGQIFPAWPGEVFTTSLWGKITTPDYVAEIQLRFLDDSFTPLTDGADRQFIRTHVYEQYFMEATAPSGTAYVQFLAWKERNNCAYFDDIRLCRDGDPFFFPDLAIEGLSVSSDSVLQGSSLSVEYAISNVGTMATPTGFDVDFYISTSNTFDQNSTLLASYPQQVLAAGDTINLTSNPGLPNSLPPGDYFLFVFVDKSQAIIELDEGNNKSVTPFTVNAPGPCDGNIILSSQADVDNFQGCPLIDGDLIIEGNDITDLTPLSSVQEISNALVVQGNPNLQSISGLEGVKKANVLVFNNNPLLENLAPLTNFSNPSIHTLRVENNDALTDLTGLESIVEVGQVSVSGNDNLQNLDGLNNLAQTTDHFTISNNSSLVQVDALSQLTYVGEDFIISTNGQLASIAGLQNLTSTAKDLVVTGANGLVDMNGLQNFQSAGGKVVVYQNALLENVDSLSVLLNAQELLIEGNPKLAACCGVFPLLENEGVTGQVLIQNNLPNCNSEAEVLSACEPVNGDLIDLELSIAAPATAPVYTSYPVEITVENTGGIAATGVKIICQKPSGVVYTGGDEWSATQGSFVYAQPQEWTVGSLAPEASATLTINYFLLQNDLPTVYAQVTAANETDADSTPNNGTPPSVNEDDEASSDDVPPAPKPDLTISNLTPAPQVVAGENMLYEFDLNNVGNAAAGEFEIGVYVSLDDQISADDVQLPSPSYPSFSVGTERYDLYFTMPSSLSLGGYYLILRADYSELVEEEEEENNVIAAPFEIVTNTICQGDMIFTSQAEVDAFSGCSVIDGNLIFRSLDGVGGASSDIYDLSPMLTVTEVTGSLIFENNDSLLNLNGLDSLTSIGGLTIVDCDSLNSIEALSGVSGDLVNNIAILYNESLPNLDGLEGVTSVWMSLSIEENAALENLDGLSGIDSVAIGSSNSPFDILDNPALRDISGLLNLDFVGGSMTIIDCPNIETLDGLDNLSFVGSNLILVENSSLSLLNDVSALSSLMSVGGSFVVGGHPLLSECCAFSNLINNNGINGSIGISNNAEGCNSEQQIIDTCAAICQGDMIFTSQAEVDAFSGCSVIDGDLIFRSPNGPSDIYDLSPLLSVTEVTGNLILENNDSLFNLDGLDNLTSIGGGFTLVLCDTINSIQALSGVKGGLQYIAMIDNTSLPNIDGLEGITKVKGSAYLEGNTALQHLDGFSNIDSMAYGGTQFSFFIEEHPSLTSVQGLHKLTFVGGIMAILKCTNLENLDGLEKLSTVARDLAIVDNYKLNDVEALESLTSIGNVLAVRRNYELSDCCIFSDLLNNNGVGGLISIAENAEGCNSEQQIIDTCTVVGDFIDLEVSINAPATAPIYTSYPVEVIVENTGNITATGVVITCQKPSGVVYTGGNEWSATQGSFVYAQPQEWAVGSLAPGESATLTVNYFLLQNDLPTAYAQVTAANEEDVDSTPNNGVPPIVSEDDEASSEDTSPPTPKPDLSIEGISILPVPITSNGGSFSFLLKNDGLAAVDGNYKIAVYISNDETVSNDDVVLPFFTEQNTPIGESARTGSVPQLLPGDYFLIVVADAENEIEETTESDNESILAFSVEEVTCGGWIFNTQAQVDNFPICSVINGDLIIRPAGGLITSDITDLSPLSSLRKVTGAIKIYRQDKLTDLHGLHNIEYCRELEIVYCDSLVDIDPLSQLHGEMDWFFLNNNHSLLNIDALAGVTAFNKGTSITDNWVLENLNGLAGLTRAGNGGEGVHIGRNHSLTTLAGLENLTTVDGYLQIDECNALQSLEGLNNVVYTEELIINHNLLLQDISALASLTTITEDLYIIHNALLSNCCIMKNLLVNNGGAFDVDISSNKAPCNSPSQVTSSCPLPGADLELSMTAANLNPEQYTSSPVTLTITNNGGETATGISVHFPRPSGTVYTGGDEYTVSQGNFVAFGTQEWSVGELASGQSATLEVNYFYLTENALTPYAQVVAQNEPDADSTPDNGTCCTPNEDDEAALILNNFTGGGISYVQLKDNRQRLAFTNVYPTPVKYWATMEVFSKEDQMVVLDFYNQQGQSVHRMEVLLEEGKNEIGVDVSEWRSGTYNIIGRGNGTPAYGRLVKVWE